MNLSLDASCIISSSSSSSSSFPSSASPPSSSKTPIVCYEQALYKMICETIYDYGLKNKMTDTPHSFAQGIPLSNLNISQSTDSKDIQKELISDLFKKNDIQLSQLLWDTIKIGSGKCSGVYNISVPMLSTDNNNIELVAKVLENNLPKMEQDIYTILSNNYYSSNSLHDKSFITLHAIYIFKTFRIMIFDKFNGISGPYLMNLNKDGQNTIKFVQIVKKVCEAVKKCHDAGICHRDIKLENISYDKETEQVLLFDFDNSAVFDINNKDNNSFTIPKGTAHAFSPEMLLYPHIPYNYKCDSWAVGILTIELILEEDMSTDFWDPNWNRSNDDFIKKINNLLIKKQNIMETTPCLKEFILELLEINPKKRPSIEQILQHNLFRKDTQQLYNFLYN